MLALSSLPLSSYDLGNNRLDSRYVLPTMSDIYPFAEAESPASSPATPPLAAEMKLTSSLEDLQTDEQRRVLDTVAQVRKCGLDSILSLPQLVVLR